MGSRRFAAAFQCAALLPFLAVIDHRYAYYRTQAFGSAVGHAYRTWLRCADDASLLCDR